MAFEVERTRWARTASLAAHVSRLCGNDADPARLMPARYRESDSDHAIPADITVLKALLPQHKRAALERKQKARTQ